jgi:hypothetical protein
MSHFQYQCCCGEASQPCPTTCVCATSYAVSGCVIDYNFQLADAQTNCTECGQGGCYRKEYSITVYAAQEGSMTVTRQTVGASGAPCCWFGEGVMDVTYTVTFQEFRQCSGALNKTYPAQSFTGGIEVPFCLHVTCRTGTAEGCSRNFGDDRHYVHKLELCDFPVACFDVLVAGSIDPISGLCDRTITCDDLGANCDAGPFSLWCGGGSVAYVSRYKCLDTLLTTDSACRGWYQSGFTCNECPAVGVDTGTAANGPFACYLREECDGGGDPPCSGAAGGGDAFLPTLIPYAPDAVKADLRSYCGSVDTVIYPTSVGCGGVDIIQSGCGGHIPWTYS